MTNCSTEIICFQKKLIYLKKSLNTGPHVATGDQRRRKYNEIGGVR